MCPISQCLERVVFDVDEAGMITLLDYECLEPVEKSRHQNEPATSQNGLHEHGCRLHSPSSLLVRRYTASHPLSSQRWYAGLDLETGGRQIGSDQTGQLARV